MKLKINTVGYEPISLTDAKEYLQVDGSHDDKLITRLITAARQMVETICGVSIVEKSIEVGSANFQTPWLLPYGPVKTMTSATVDGETAEIDGDYITTSGAILEAEYIAGFEELPAGLEQAMYELIKLYYDARGMQMQIPDTLYGALQKYSRNLVV
ncbi:MAG: hypothetical protein EA392_00915 [Cryomorphaceae bacterium]|nr:MAG: hypothetical protein EA392_00915 [Cryomorphaceae bacterium]